MTTLALDVLTQTEFWVNGAGAKVYLSDMAPEYLANVRRYLDRRAPEVHAAYLWAATHPPFPADLPVDVNREIAHYATTDEQFMASRPLYRKIVRLLGAGTRPGSHH